MSRTQSHAMADNRSSLSKRNTTERHSKGKKFSYVQKNPKDIGGNLIMSSIMDGINRQMRKSGSPSWAGKSVKVDGQSFNQSQKLKQEELLAANDEFLDFHAQKDRESDGSREREGYSHFKEDDVGTNEDLLQEGSSMEHPYLE